MSKNLLPKQLLVVLASGSLMLAACEPAPTQKTPSTDTSTKTQTTDSTDHNTMPPTGAMDSKEAPASDPTRVVRSEADKTVTVNMSGGSFYFNPNEIKAKKGDTVVINFSNDGGMHNFTIDEFNAKTKTVKTGETDSISFVVDKTGSFEYYCSVGQHRSMGQKGMLIVEE